MRLLMAAVLLLAPTLAQAWPWSMDMANQISIKPQESADTQNPGMRPFPKRSVPIPGTTSLVKDREVAEKQSNPVPADEKSIALGGKLFQIYCTPCHGYSGKGDIIVVSIKDAIPKGKVKKGDVHKAVIVRTRKEIKRLDGTSIKFDANAAVLVQPNGEPIGTRIFGPVTRELRNKNFMKIISLAPEVL